MTLVPQERRAAAGVVLLLAALVAVLFREILFQGHVLYERDIALMLYGQSESFVRSLAAGSWPVWDPWVGFGQPMLANPGAQVLYPWTWLNLALVPETAFTFYVVSHLVLAGAGLAALARDGRMSLLAALAAGGCFMLSGPLLSMVNLWQHLAGAAWIPWVLLACRRTLRAPSHRASLLWGAAAAAQVLTGSVEMCAMTALLQAAVVAHGLRASGTSLRPVAGAALVAASLAAALTAGMWLPAAELLLGSTRTALGADARAYWSLHPLNLVQALAPFFPQVLPLRPEIRTLLYEGREPFIGSVYLGLAALPLACMAFLGSRGRLAAWIAALGALAALVSLGRFGVAYPILTDLLPPLRIFRFPSKAILLTALAWSLLVGLGLDALRTAPPRRKAIGLAAIVAAAAVALLALLAPSWAGAWLSPGPHAGLAAILAPAVRRALVASALAVAAGALLVFARCPPAGLLAAVALAELLVAHRPLNPTALRELIFRRPAVVDALGLGGDPARLYVFDYFMPPEGDASKRRVSRKPEGVAGIDALLSSTLYSLDALFPPSSRRFGLYGSYDHDWLLLYPRELRELTVLVHAREESPEFPKLLRIGGVARIVALHAEGLEAFPERAKIASPFCGTIRVFGVPGSQPRAYVVGGTRIADGASGLAALLDPDFEPSRQVLLPEGEARPAPPLPVGEARIVPGEYRPDRVRLEARLDAPGYLVLLDAFDPGWRARVDGEPAPLVRANTAFRAVALPPGAHRVELVYRPPLLILGLALSSAAAAACVGLLLRSATRDRPRRRVP